MANPHAESFRGLVSYLNERLKMGLRLGPTETDATNGNVTVVLMGNYIMNTKNRRRSSTRNPAGVIADDLGLS